MMKCGIIGREFRRQRFRGDVDHVEEDTGVLAIQFTTNLHVFITAMLRHDEKIEIAVAIHRPRRTTTEEKQFLGLYDADDRITDFHNIVFTHKHPLFCSFW